MASGVVSRGDRPVSWAHGSHDIAQRVVAHARGGIKRVGCVASVALVVDIPPKAIAEGTMAMVLRIGNQRLRITARIIRPRWAADDAICGCGDVTRCVR